MRLRSPYAGALVVLALSPPTLAAVGLLRERLAGHNSGSADLVLPAGVQVKRDVAYGADPEQRLDVYLPQRPKAAPILMLVHGGGWRWGDKAHRPVVENKVGHWLPKGVIVVSANYRLLPKATPREQAQDVARALACVQAQASAWGGDPTRVVLMGHSAGAHLVALLAADSALASAEGVRPWRGTVSLDSAALDIVETMGTRHLRLYDSAFGENPADWRAASPQHQLTRVAAPLLLVCSTRRADSCPQARRFADTAVGVGGEASVLPLALSHRDVNQQLGTTGAYTTSVDAFLHSLGML